MGSKIFFIKMESQFLQKTIQQQIGGRNEKENKWFELSSSIFHAAQTHTLEKQYRKIKFLFNNSVKKNLLP